MAGIDSLPSRPSLGYTVAQDERFSGVIMISLRRIPPAQMLLLAMASGASALAFELLWEREMTLVFGASHYAVTTVLAAFMAGMGLGALGGGSLADSFRRPFLMLGIVEGLMACLGPLLTLIFGHIPGLAAHLLPEASIFEPSALALRFGLSFLLMLPATLLMGASFPLMVRSTGEDTTRFHSGISWIYGFNTAGGILGVLGVSFLLLPRYGVPASAAMGAGSNLLAAALAFHLHLRSRETRTPPAIKARKEETRIEIRLQLLAALSGGAVLAGETLWNRILAIALPNSTYTFALLLAITLFGLASGGVLARKLVCSETPLISWGRLQLLMAAWMLAAIPLSRLIPIWVRHHRPPMGWGRVLASPLSVGSFLILPAAMLLGMAWPLLLAAAAPRAATGGRCIGRMAFINSLGAGGGALIAGWVLIPRVGFGGTFLLLAALHLLMFLILPAQGSLRTAFALPASALVICAFLLPAFLRIPLPSTTADPSGWKTLLYREGPTGTVRVIEDLRHGGLSLYVDNSSVIGNSFDALKVARMLGLLPALLHPQGSETLVIGFGAGVTSATLAASPGIRNIEAREIVPAVVEAAPFFRAVNHDILNNSKLHLGFGDGRNFLLLSPKRWDIITCDPIHPLYGSAALYSEDFFSLAASRLQAGGIFFQYLPLHQMPPRAFRQAIYTFARVFPNARVAFSMGHAVLIGSMEAMTLDWERWRRVLEDFQYPGDLVDSCLSSPAQIATLFQLDEVGIRRIARGPASTDHHPILEFLEPEAFEPGCWEANAKALIEAYDSPLEEIHSLPTGFIPDLKRLVAAKRLLLFAQLQLRASHPREAFHWLQKAQRLAPSDPEILRFAREFEPAP